MIWPTGGVVWVWVGGNYRNIDFLGNLQAHSHILSIYNNFFKIHIQIALAKGLGFFFPKNTLIDIAVFLVVEQKGFVWKNYIFMLRN